VNTDKWEEDLETMGSLVRKCVKNNAMFELGLAIASTGLDGIKLLDKFVHVNLKKLVFKLSHSDLIKYKIRKSKKDKDSTVDDTTSIASSSKKKQKSVTSKESKKQQKEIVTLTPFMIGNIDDDDDEDDLGMNEKDQ